MSHIQLPTTNFKNNKLEELKLTNFSPIVNVSTLFPELGHTTCNDNGQFQQQLLMNIINKKYLRDCLLFSTNT